MASVSDQPSNIERAFLLGAVAKGVRADGRGPTDLRALRIACGPTHGLAEVQLGQTRVLARVTCAVARPLPDRPTEGLVQVNAELASLAMPPSPQTTAAAMEEEMAVVSRMVDRVIRQSRAVDTEALCIVAGQKVWSLRLDLRILDHGGNLVDAAMVAATASLRHFRRPDVTVDGTDAVIHDPRDRNPVPLSIHHSPVCVSFAFLGHSAAAAGQEVVLLVDPSRIEEQTMVSRYTVTLNPHREVCALSKAGGAALPLALIQRCNQIALVKADEINEKIQEALKSQQQ
ncbi:3'-5'-exoribonuclease [Coemansia sp. RSA 1939]|nr:3'-5'-exoribonuclease [Coemansia sp. RSA 1939]KAJ2602333.1 3'-5'-exoribonuclease [Coemansia sp. RSA 1804]